MNYDGKSEESIWWSKQTWYSFKIYHLESTSMFNLLSWYRIHNADERRDHIPKCTKSQNSPLCHDKHLSVKQATTCARIRRWCSRWWRCYLRRLAARLRSCRPLSSLSHDLREILLNEGFTVIISIYAIIEKRMKLTCSSCDQSYEASRGCVPAHVPKQPTTR